MAILLVAEHDDAVLSEQTGRALAAALRIGGAIDILVAGGDCAAVAEEAARLAGVRRVLLAEDERLAGRLAEPMAALLVSLADRYGTFIAPASASGRSIMPRLAALLDVMQVSDVIDIVAPDIFRRPIYAGNAIETVQSQDAKIVLTIRTAAFPIAASGGTAGIERVVPAGEPAPPLSRVLGAETAHTDRPDLTSARVVISGGRAFGSAATFNALLVPIAERLGAAIGASRAAVDAGYAPNDAQVGQTGKIVAPDLYIACGISGAIQHLAGMKGSKVIVAINSDPDAPIFQVADFGLVGDIFTVLPALAAALQDAGAGGADRSPEDSA